MADEAQQARREQLTSHSNRLLDAIDDLHQLEKDKHAEVISTPPFHAFVEDVRAKSRAVFRMADDIVEEADHVETSDVSMDDVSGTHRDTSTSALAP